MPPPASERIGLGGILLMSLLGLSFAMLVYNQTRSYAISRRVFMLRDPDPFAMMSP